MHNCYNRVDLINFDNIKVICFPQKLCDLTVDNCNHQFVDKVLSRLRRGLFKNLEELCIGYCGAKVVFQLEDLIIERQQHELSLPKLKSLKLYHL